MSKDENLLKTKRGAREGEIRTNRKLDNGYHLVVHHAAGAIIYYCDILMKYIGLDDDWMVS
ncbi:MAG: hypothetical protein EBX41_06825 [Chitinophagia bacterium]|nr:hypothetical protein [Chitinophagia bacterium]